MLNCEMVIKGSILTVTVDLSKDFGRSKSGKTVVIASTKGNQTIDEGKAVIGLNVYRYPVNGE